MQNKISKLISILFIFLQLIVLFATSCNGNSADANPDEYSVFKFNDDDIRFKLQGSLIHEHSLFTFEYPSSFEKKYDEDEILQNMRVTMVTFERQPKSSPGSLPRSSLSITIGEPGLWNESDAKTVIENTIIYHSLDPKFKIIENTSAVIAGSNAFLLSYSFHQPLREVFGSAPVPEYDGVVKLACFDYQNLIWRIYLNCLLQELPETEVYFQHILDTFQIIE